MAAYEASIIIPVFNRWELTRACLKSLAETIDQNRVEVIVVDNASTDVTARACPFLGEKLFGQSFQYIRNGQNRNFAGASNQGATAARGEYLIFLNNDTRATPGWYEPLLADFAEHPRLGATGPLLLYPEQGPFGHAVQHLGVLVSPIVKFGHLYQGIAESSRLAAKRRSFQAITAACMMMRKNLFMQTGRFDERYINGFEDVDLCGRILAQGCQFSVNPASRVFHYEGQTQGRGSQENNNFDLLQRTSLKFFHPDWHSLLKDDGLQLVVDDFLLFQPRLSPGLEAELDARLPGMDADALKKTITDHPYWRKGWEAYLGGINDPGEHLANFKIYFKFFRTLPNALEAARLGALRADPDLRTLGRNALAVFAETPEKLLENAQILKKWCEQRDMPELAGQYGQWIENYANFTSHVYPKYGEAIAQA